MNFHLLVLGEEEAEEGKIDYYLETNKTRSGESLWCNPTESYNAHKTATAWDYGEAIAYKKFQEALQLQRLLLMSQGQEESVPGGRGAGRTGVSADPPADQLAAAESKEDPEGLQHPANVGDAGRGDAGAAPAAATQPSLARQPQQGARPTLHQEDPPSAPPPVGQSNAPLPSRRQPGRESGRPPHHAYPNPRDHQQHHLFLHHHLLMQQPQQQHQGQLERMLAAAAASSGRGVPHHHHHPHGHSSQQHPPYMPPGPPPPGPRRNPNALPFHVLPPEHYPPSHPYHHPHSAAAAPPLVDPAMMAMQNHPLQSLRAAQLLSSGTGPPPLFPAGDNAAVASLPSHLLQQEATRIPPLISGLTARGVGGTTTGTGGDDDDESGNDKKKKAKKKKGKANAAASGDKKKKRTAPSSSDYPKKKQKKLAEEGNGDPSAKTTSSPAAKTIANLPPWKPPTDLIMTVTGQVPAAIPPSVATVPPYEERKRDNTIISLATDEDQNWLSEFQCFIRAEVLEIFRANAEDVRVRNNSKMLVKEQIGIRCRFCAHIPPGARASRSSAFPSSIPQIYQSFTMMLRDHLSSCQSIPSPQKDYLEMFKSKNNQGASDSKNYWVHAARRSGMVNTDQGIDINEKSRQAAYVIPPFGSMMKDAATIDSLKKEQDDTAPLVLPGDKQFLHTDYLFVLFSNFQRVRLIASERVGNRKSLRQGLPGFGCRFCCRSGRLGLSRVFPARRRTLPSKIPDLYDHLRRCSLCPEEIKQQLESLKSSEDEWQYQQPEAQTAQANYREFYSRIWSRLGHGSNPEPTEEAC